MLLILRKMLFQYPLRICLFLLLINQPALSNDYVDPEIRAFLDHLVEIKAPSINTLPISEGRAMLSNAQAQLHIIPAAQIETIKIPLKQFGTVSANIIRPENTTQALPIIIYFHGGGWVLGGVDTHDRLARDLAIGAHAAVVLVDYSRSPEAQYPVPIEQAYAATKWISNNAKRLKLDASRLAVAGDSAGGNLATVTTLLSKQRHGPKIMFQLLFYPAVDANFTTPSSKRYANGYFLTADIVRWAWNQYIPQQKDREKITASPLRASLTDLSGLPETLIITAENDLLRDEGEAYAAKLRAAGVKVTATRYLGAIHDFVMLNAIYKSKPAQAAISQATNMLKTTFYPGEN
jgi:acetyl esterase